MDKKIIELKHPVTVDKVTTRKLAMRIPRVKDQLAAEKVAGSNAEMEIRMFANLCEVTPEVIEEMTLADYAKLQEAAKDFSL